MKSRLKPITDDARYPDLVARYAGDLCAFAEEVCGMTLQEDTRRILRQAGLPGLAMVVSELATAPEGPLAPIALWCLLFQRRNWVVVVAPRTAHLLAHADCYRRVMTGPHSWIGQYLSISQKGVRTAGGYSGPHIHFRVAHNHAPETLAGMGSEQLVVLVEGAHAVSRQCVDLLSASIRPGSIKSVRGVGGFTIAHVTE